MLDPTTHPFQSENIYIHLVRNQQLAIVPSFTLESGVTLKDVPVAYKTWGRLNEKGDNVMVICHALSGSADVEDWWGPLLGRGRAFDTSKFFIVCCNVLGSPYGTASPVTINPETRKRYGPEFPLSTIRDDVRLHKHVLDQLKVTQVQFVIGGSMGGMQTLEWAFFGKEFVRHIVAIATSGRHSAWCISWGETQRQTIFADPEYGLGLYPLGKGPLTGLASARMQAMLTYRSRNSFESRFGRKLNTIHKPSTEKTTESIPPLSLKSASNSIEKKQRDSSIPSAHISHNEGVGIWRLPCPDPQPSSSTFISSSIAQPAFSSLTGSQPPNSEVFSAQSYLRYQGDKFIKRFDANCYIAITRKMDTHDISRGRGSFEGVLKRIDQPTLVIGVESDGLFTISEQYELAQGMPNAEMKVIQSQDGHDGFLLEFGQMNEYIGGFIRKVAHPSCFFGNGTDDEVKDGDSKLQNGPVVGGSLFGEIEDQDIIAW